MRVRNDGQMQAKADELGSLIRSEPDGVTAAVRTIENIFEHQ